MTILLIGNTGQVGYELESLLKKGTESNSVPFFKHDLVSLDYPAIDLADPDSIVSVIREHRPRLIINAAAYTAVDKAEEEEEKALAINGTAPGIMAEEVLRYDGALVHYSTDYVFDGTKEGAYTEDDIPNPLSVYGRSKFAGENAVIASQAPHLILRTSWIYGGRGKNFLLTILKLAHEREELRIIDDQTGAPTWCRDLATATIQILTPKKGTESHSAPFFPYVPQFLLDHGGLYHLTNTGATTWHGFAKAIVEQDPDREEQALKNLVPIPTEDYPTPAPRPKNSRLDCTKANEAFNVELPPWDESLKNVMSQL